MNIFNISVLCFGFMAVFLGITIYLKRRDRLGKIWLAFNLLCCLWTIGYSFQINNEVPYERALWLSRISDAFAAFIPIAWLHFVCEFLGRKIKRWIFPLLYTVSGGIFLTFPTPLLIPYLKDKSIIGLAHFAHPGPAFHVLTVLYSSVVGYAFFLMLKAWLSPSLPHEKRNQLRYLLIASGIGFGSGSLAFLPVYDIDLPVQWGALLIPFFPLMMVFAVTRYRLLDVEEVLHAARQDKLEAISTLAASVNHEIKNPLFISKGLAEGFLEKMEEGLYRNPSEAIERSKEILEKIALQNARALDIIKRFAVFARAEAGDKPRTEAVNFLETLDTVFSLVQHELGMDKITLSKEVPESLPYLKIDARHLEEILFNLILNAGQALKGQGGTISVSAKSENGCMVICVSDTGPGIPADKLSKIFEPFYTTKSEGTGLGLYIVRELVAKNGGKIEVTSVLGRGTAFTLEFPNS